MPLRNVLVFVLAGARYALELRWVREVVTISAITPVPTAPDVIAGAINFRGTIMPLVAPHILLTPHPPPERVRQPRVGDQAILVDVDGTRVALPADRINEVTSLAEAPSAPPPAGASPRTASSIPPPDALTQLPEAVLDARGRVLPLVDPQAVLAEVHARVHDAAIRLTASLAGDS